MLEWQKTVKSLPAEWQVKSLKWYCNMNIPSLVKTLSYHRRLAHNWVLEMMRECVIIRESGVNPPQLLDAFVVEESCRLQGPQRTSQRSLINNQG